MASKIDKADAQEWLESLQQVGEGWYRQVALAVRAGAHKALGMERREFTQAIGQRMIDPSEAIIELYHEGHAIQPISDVLHISYRTVNNALIAAGLIEGDPYVMGPDGRWHRKAIASPDNVGAGAGGSPDNVGAGAGGSPDNVDEIASQRAAIEQLQAQIKGEQKKRRDDIRDLKDKIAGYQRALVDAEREAREKAEQGLNDKERERARKEAEAWAQEQGRQILAGVAHLVTARVVSALEEATEGVRELIGQDAVTGSTMAEIDRAAATFTEEINMARLASEGK